MYKYRQLTQEEKIIVVQERLAKGYPPHSPPHPVENSEFYLITVTCYEHKCRINSEERRQQLLNQLFEHFTYQDIEILAWVVLPNHYHLLVKNLDFKRLSKVLRSIHGSIARQWNLEDNLTGKLWCSFSDRAIRSERHYYTTLNYIHYNPVKHGWAKSPYAWIESSVHWYLENYGRDWLRSCWIEYPVIDYGKGWDDL
ncbi:REP-associated tyrosine transposase [Nostoc sp.]|uniref:REP-associated tyrosine transposase n=1 Tax=Nostoc sp. TaxID=1180 RepID=UPI002FFBF77E